MRQSNGYVMISTMGLTVVCAALLAAVSTVLTPKHRQNADVDAKKKILMAYEVLPPGTSNETILELYAERIEGIVVDYKGNEVTEGPDGQPVEASKIDILKEYKKPNDEDKLFPVFKYKSEVFEGEYGAYIIPMWGNGLWDYIWGYVALEPDFNTVKGAVFAHKGETPGLGARITDLDVQQRFIGKKVFDDGGDFQSIAVLKGEGNDQSKITPHTVDGLSGATMTAEGVTVMLSDYFQFYQPYMEKAQGDTPSGEEEKKIDLRNDIVLTGN